MSPKYAIASSRCWVRLRRGRAKRGGHLLVLLAILLPSLIGIIGLVFDGGLMMHDLRHLQHAVDGAATAAATDLRLGKSSEAAALTATESIQSINGITDAVVAVHIPPTVGQFAGVSGYVEVTAEITHRPRFMPFVDGVLERKIATRAVAGIAAVTASAAMVMLDPDPPDLSIPPLPALPAAPSILAGLEIEGLGRLTVDGAVLVNNAWGGVDENGNGVGTAAGPPYAVTCTPLLPLTRLRARDLRVVGGVDDPDNYRSYPSGGANPLQANRLAVPAPFEGLAPPLTSNDPDNVSSTLRGGRRVTGLPLIGPPVNLQPGVYDYITIVSGIVNFAPGVYIIRDIDPITQSSLSIVAGTVNAQGVLFYVTNSHGYDGALGAPDSSDGETAPAVSEVSHLTPSVIIQGSLLGSGISGLNDPGSPFDGMVIYQRRMDRRPIVIVQQSLLGAGRFSGTVYAKWGHVVFAGNGTYDASFVCGTMRVLTVFDTTFAPSKLLPPARDVLLVE
jgi:hypothetical protein